jgi:hypothetical protein
VRKHTYKSNVYGESKRQIPKDGPSFRFQEQSNFEESTESAENIQVAAAEVKDDYYERSQSMIIHD